MNQNWIVENLNNAFSTWNGKLTELWGLVTTSPQSFKGGAVWGVMQSLHSAMVGIGYALIVLFFAISLFKNTMNFHELKRPEAALHYLIRFVAAKALVGYGMDIMLNIFSICNGVVSDMAAGMGGISQAMVTLPGEMQSAIENVGFLASIPLWLVTILGSLFITVLSFVMILTVYGRFFRIYMYTALAPLSLASFAGAPSLNRQTFRPFFQINAFPTLYNFMVVNSEFLHRCIDTQMFFSMVSTTILLNSVVYRLFGTSFGIAKHPTC